MTFASNTRLKFPDLHDQIRRRATSSGGTRDPVVLKPTERSALLIQAGVTSLGGTSGDGHFGSPAHVSMKLQDNSQATRVLPRGQGQNSGVEPDRRASLPTPHLRAKTQKDPKKILPKKYCKMY